MIQKPVDNNTSDIFPLVFQMELMQNYFTRYFINPIVEIYDSQYIVNSIVLIFAYK